MTCKFLQTSIVTNEIRPTIQFVHEYPDKKIISICTDDIMNGITMKFKKYKSYGDVIFIPIELPMKLLS
jgi:hypothetical protein